MRLNKSELIFLAAFPHKLQYIQMSIIMPVLDVNESKFHDFRKKVFETAEESLGF